MSPLLPGIHICFFDLFSAKMPQDYTVVLLLCSNIAINRIPVIRGFAVRVTPISTNKKHAVNTLKMAAPSRFKAGLIWTGRTSVSILKDIQRFLIFVENKYSQSRHTSRYDTRAGFDSVPLATRFKLFRANF
jgi:hypothetical protein